MNGPEDYDFERVRFGSISLKISAVVTADYH